MLATASATYLFTQKVVLPDSRLGIDGTANSLSTWTGQIDSQLVLVLGACQNHAIPDALKYIIGSFWTHLTLVNNLDVYEWWCCPVTRYVDGVGYDGRLAEIKTHGLANQPYAKADC